MVLETELSAKNIIQGIGSLSVAVVIYNFGNRKLETRRTANIGQKNEETAKHPRTALPRGKRRLIISSQKTGQGG